MLTGGCLCGAVPYEVDGNPQYAVLCHCRDCQRSSGSGHVPVMGMPRSLFRATGETKSYAAKGSGGRASIRHFCPVCGSLLFGMPDAAPESVSIYVGTLDDPSAFRPEAALFISCRHDWDVGASALTEFETMPDAAEKV